MPIHLPDPEVYLYTDASHFVWGAHLEPMSLSFRGRWSEDRSRLHISMLEMMAIRFPLIKALKYIRHSCVMISTDNTTLVSYMNKQGGTHSPNLCVQVWKILLWCLKHHIVDRIRHIPGKFNVFGRQVIENRQSSQNRVGIGSIDSEFNFPNVQLSQSGSVCDSLQSQTATLCIPSSGQSSFRDRRIFHELELSSCLRLSSNNVGSFCSEQDTPISVQNSSDSSCLATTSLVLRGPTTTCLSSSSSSSCSKPIVKQKESSSIKFSQLSNFTHEVIKQSIRDKKKHRKTLRILSPDQDEHQLRKSLMRHGSFIPVGVIEGRLIRSLTVVAEFLIYPLLRENVLK